MVRSRRSRGSKNAIAYFLKEANAAALQLRSPPAEEAKTTDLKETATIKQNAANIILGDDEKNINRIIFFKSVTKIRAEKLLKPLPVAIYRVFLQALFNARINFYKKLSEISRRLQ